MQGLDNYVGGKRGGVEERRMKVLPAGMRLLEEWGIVGLLKGVYKGSI